MSEQNAETGSRSGMPIIDAIHEKPIESPWNSAGSCSSVHFLNKLSSSISEKTVLVFGCGRGGTSAVAGVLRILGVNMPNAHPLKHEWSPICYEGKQVDREATRRTIESFDLQYPIWGWKAPKDVFCLDQYIAMLRNPHIVIVFRNILDILDSTRRNENIDFVASAIEIADVYNELCHRLTFTCLPVALINYEKICAVPMETISSIDCWLNLNSSKETLVSAANFTQFGRGKYLTVGGDGSTALSFDPCELAVDRAEAQITVYGKRLAQLSSFHTALVDDLKIAYEIKKNLEKKICELCPEVTFSNHTFDIEGNVVYSNIEVTLVDSKLLSDMHMDELVRYAKSVEVAYYEMKERYLAVLRDRIAIQKILDDLATKRNLLESNQ